MNKKAIISTVNNTILNLKVSAKKKEGVRRKLVITAKRQESVWRKLAATAKEKENARRKKLVVTAEKLAVTAAKLVATAKEKELVRRRLAVTAEKLAATAKEKELVRRRLAITAEKLVVTAATLAVTADELSATAAKLAVIAKEKEIVRRKLAVTAAKLKESYEKLEKKVLERTKDLEMARVKEEAILLSIGDGVAVVDETGKLVFFNKIASDILGTDANQGLPDTWQKRYGVFDPISLKPLATDQIPFTLAFKGQSVSKMPLFIRNPQVPNGKFISVTATPIFLGGKSIGGVAIFRDMTEEKEVDKAKTEFVSLASHQLRTPLSTVNWYAEMLLAGDVGALNEKQKKYLDEVYRSNQRMVELVNALLDVSSLELGTFAIEPKPTDIIKLTQSVIDEQKPQITVKRMKFSFSSGKNITLIQADPKLLRMVVQNILSNAVKYTPEGGEIKLSISLADKKNILLEVSDTGYGIPKNQQDKIFTKLFRADNVRDKDTDGTGLGLYIVKSIVEKSGGKIWFHSSGEVAGVRASRGADGKENKGTTFYVTLPLVGMKKSVTGVK
jgi:signal transduction histidine kinase